MPGQKELVKPETILCGHCGGRGECFCPECAPSSDPPGSYRDEFDAGRQEEGQCRKCNGMGRTTLDDKPIGPDDQPLD